MNDTAGEYVGCVSSRHIWSLVLKKYIHLHRSWAGRACLIFHSVNTLRKLVQFTRHQRWKISAFPCTKKRYHSINHGTSSWRASTFTCMKQTRKAQKQYFHMALHHRTKRILHTTSHLSSFCSLQRFEANIQQPIPTTIPFNDVPWGLCPNVPRNAWWRLVTLHLLHLQMLDVSKTFHHVLISGLEAGMVVIHELRGFTED